MSNLPRRPDALFGRQPDLDQLHARSGTAGITAVVGRPQLGKSWLLGEFAYQLAEQDGGPVVGYAASQGDEPQLLLRAAKDLYVNWLANSKRRERAKRMWRERRRELLPAVGEAVTAVLQTADPTGISGAVHRAFDRLAAGGGREASVQLQPLEYGHSRDLVRAAAETSGRPVVLILDQWDESPNQTYEARLLAHLLRELESWPTCCVTLGIRAETEAVECFESEIGKTRPGPAERYDLARMHLDEPSERQRLVDWLHAEVPATREAEPDTLLDLIDGNPAVLLRWRDNRPDTLDALSHYAREAHQYLYKELEEDALPNLDRELMPVAARLVLLPMASSGDLWPNLGPFVLGEQLAACLDELVSSGVLVRCDPPSYGHARRAEAAWAWLEENRRQLLKSEIQCLAPRLGAQVTSTADAVVPYASALTGLRGPARTLDADLTAQVPCEAAIALWPDGRADVEKLLQGAAAAVAKEPGCATLVAKGLYNTLNDAKQEDDLDRRGALLDELRTLVREHPEPAVRGQLAHGLAATMMHL